MIPEPMHGSHSMLGTVERYRKRLTVVKPAVRWLSNRRSPWFLTWALTERCNYRCDHCGCWREPGAELSKEQAREYAHEMVDAGIVGVNLCGGEVLLRRDVGEVIAILRRGGVLTRITTNGQLVPERIDELKPLNRIKISLDGPPDLHDDVRGRGAYDRVVAAVEAASRAGIPIQLNTVLTRRVIERLDALLETVGALEQRVTFQPIELRSKSALRGVDSATPEPDRMRWAVRRLKALKRAGDDRIGSSLGTLEYMDTWPELEPVDCHAGRRFCRVLSDGRVVACDRPYAPQKPPEPGSAAGFRAGIAALERAGHCQGCWRNNTIELNRALSGSAGAIDSVRKWI